MAHRRGLMTGLVVTSYTAGTAVFAPLFGLGTDAFGVHPTFLVAAVLMTAVGLVVSCLFWISRTEIHGSQRARRGGRTSSGRWTFWLLWLGCLFGSSAAVMVLGHAAAIVASFGATVQQFALGSRRPLRRVCFSCPAPALGHGRWGSR